MFPSIKASRPGPETDHHMTTTMFDCWYDVLFIMLCWFYARSNGTHTFQKVQLLSHQSTEYLGIIKIFFGKCETSLCVVFDGFCLGGLPRMLFLPSLFLIVES